MEGIETLLDQLDLSRERLLMAIEILPDEVLLQPRTIGRLSVADLLALQAAWESELVTGLMRLDQGKEPERLLAALAHPEAYDARRFEEYRGRDLDRIFDDLQKVRMQLESWLETFSERDLMSRTRFKWLKGKSVKQLIAKMTFERESTYLADLEAFSQRWSAEFEAEPSEIVIPLSAVSSEAEFSLELESNDEKSD